MSLFIQASNIHVGGGKTLLLPLLQALQGPATVYIDERLSDLPPLHPDVAIFRVKPTILGRWLGERDLARRASAGDVLLCFGNLPPLFPSKAAVRVYLHNRYLAENLSTSGLPLRVRLRIAVERMLLRLGLRDAELVVQTQTMATAAQAKFGRTPRVIGFAPALPAPAFDGNAIRKFDFVYVASGEAHKNHRRLVEAWTYLAKMDIRPSLCLTLTEQRDGALWRWVKDEAEDQGLDIHLRAVSNPGEVARLLAESGTLIYPSLFEAFGIPMLEAQTAGLAVLAPERDYVRDLLAPQQTFDPLSARSIARAAMRHLGQTQSSAPVLDPATFLDLIKKAP
ncbi:glycosyltransferase [Devosia beringensis]|uniref:glycosyltransferase n=1 Tax=Devosia beringensis TaxID=2657486 RepID=UPI00186B5AFC|nr:glycosyltransferase [Devosia beringensis]